MGDASFELKLERVLNAPRHNVWRCWTEAELLEQWFAPHPWTAKIKELDLRPGGGFHVSLRGPEGEESGGPGVFLAVEPEERLIFTDAFQPGWLPSGQPFMTAIIELASEGDRTRYTARALHWREEDRKTHEDMGFHDGWGQVAGQLEAIAAKL